MRRATALPAALLLLAAGCGTVRHQVPVVHERQVRLDVTPPQGSVPDLEVVFVRGLVVVEPGTLLAGSIEASVTAASEEDVERFAAAITPRVAVDAASGRLVLSISHPEGASLAAVSATFRLQVPKETALTIRTDSGDIACRGYAGQLTVDTIAGDIDVTLAGGSAELRNQRGRIRLRGEFGAANLRNDMGATEVVLPGGLTALVDIQQGMGSLLLGMREMQRLQLAAIGEVRSWDLHPAVVFEWTESRPQDGEDQQVGTIGDPQGIPAGELQLRAAGPVRFLLVRLPNQLLPPALAGGAASANSAH